ncbi:MAG: quinolinate synthase NadA [Paludibacteraceae bacterium]|nr:quinolinate synthase NadA [Paludibacteraceae bacterium]
MNNNNLKKEILRLKKENNACIMAHYYQEDDIQDVADFIGDSLALAKIATTVKEDIIIVCGVNFMGETAKILSPDKKVIMPDINAGCSLADSCSAEDLEVFIKNHPGYKVISYVNTSAKVKALTDIVVTSSNAKKIVDSLPKEEKIIFGPDKNLGGYINKITGRDMLLWDGGCHVHQRFSYSKIVELKKQYPNAEILVHPECPSEIVDIADFAGSTLAILNYAGESKANIFIIVTECGILHQLQIKYPDKRFIAAPVEEDKIKCNKCDYMRMCTLEKLYDCLKNKTPEIVIEEKLRIKALKPIRAMLELS